MENKELTIRPTTEISQFSSKDVLNQIALIQEIMKNAMQDHEHYGVIPGTSKPTLLKAGAEKLGLTFRLEPEYEVHEQFLEKEHYYCRIKCTLKHILTGQRWGDGVGSCSTMETKYKYRNQNRHCPKCGQETIIQGKAEFGGGFICWAKKGGCGAKFPDDDIDMINQKVGRVENEDLADVYNTILKMAAKRSHVAAMLSATAASDIFTQDIEEMRINGNQTQSNVQPKSTPVQTNPHDKEINLTLDEKKVQIYQVLKTKCNTNSSLFNTWNNNIEKATDKNIDSIIKTINMLKNKE